MSKDVQTLTLHDDLYFGFLRWLANEHIPAKSITRYRNIVMLGFEYRQDYEIMLKYDIHHECCHNTLDVEVKLDD